MYRLSPREKQEVEEQVADLLKRGWIEPSTSPYGAPIVFAQKKDGSLRMCVDYRALNAITVKNRYPLPRIDDLLDQLHGATRFTSIDLQMGYHQIKITADDVPKTAFLTHQGLFQYRVLCFGISNAPSTFQAVMNKALAPVLGKTALVYMDDILVFSKNPDDHAQHLAEELELLRQHKLYAKLSKCSFAQERTNFLGHVISADGIRVDPRKVLSLENWPAPTKVEHVRAFLGLATYYRKFVEHFATKAHALHQLLRKTTVWQWGEAQQEAFDSIKGALMNAPVLAVPDLRPNAAPFHVICDASGVGLGAILEQDGHPVAYESRKMNGAELNYGAGEQELLAVVHAMRTWRCYLEGAKCVVVTDHNPLTYLQTQPNLSRRQVRWSEFLQNYDFEWLYRPGASNPADPLSRLPLYEKLSPFEKQCAVLLHVSQLEAKERVVRGKGLLLMAITRSAAAHKAMSKVLSHSKPKRQSRSLVPAVRAEPEGEDPPGDTDSADEATTRARPTAEGILERCRAGYQRDPWYKDGANTIALKEDGGLYKFQDKIAVPMWIHYA
jgi:hypothetical protein